MADHKKNLCHRWAEKGSSLIGIALLMIAFGFLITGGIYIIQTYAVVEDDQATRSNTQDIEKAIQDFVAINGRYPCPADFTSGLDTAAFGIEACGGVTVVTSDGVATSPEVLIGTVPTRSLNLPDKKIVDGHGARYIYAVTRTLTAATADFNNDEGAITLRDNIGNSISETDGNIVYLVISPGENTQGVYNLDGKQENPACGAGYASEVCNFTDAIFTTRSVADTDFNFTRSFAFRVNPISYKWFTDAYNACTGPCFGSTQTRTVTCRDNKTNVVADANCLAFSAKPQETQFCTLPRCNWRYGGWRGTCGAGSTYSAATTPAGNGLVTPITTSSSGGSAGGGSTGDGGGGSVLCGHFFSRGILSSNIYKGDLLFATRYVNDATKRGYRLWAVPLTRHLNANPNGIIEKLVQPFVVSWAQEMAFRTGQTDKGHWLGKIQLAVAKPVVNFIGLFVKDTHWSELQSEKDIQEKKNNRGLICLPHN